MSRRARAFHLLTGLVAAVALLLQFALVWQGHSVLDERNPPNLAARVERFFCYFTVLSNILVSVVTLKQAGGHSSDSRVWRVLRINAVVGITVTGMLHWFFLSPLLDLDGLDYAADKLLHVAVPILAILGWVAFGPREQIWSQDLLPSTIFPSAYMAWTLVHGEWRDWYPYPFTDVSEHGYPTVLLNGLAIVALMVVLTFGAVLLDRRLADAGRRAPN